jgi:type I restriction enzyme M protein
MFEAGEVKEWRQEVLLEHNTLMSVLTLPTELFYPIGVHTLGMIVKKGVKHPENQNVLWARILHDGFIKIKGKRLLSQKEPNEFIELLPTIQAFVQNPAFQLTAIPEKIKASPIDFEDPLLELVPEAYLDAKIPTEDEIKEAAEQLVRENTTLAVKHPNLWQKVEGHAGT